MAPTGEPRQSPKPQPLGHFPSLLLFTTVTLCFLFILWRRANALRTVVSHQLKTWSRRDGGIRLSEDDGPPAHTFLEDEYDIDGDGIADDAQILHDELRSAGPEPPASPPPTAAPVE